MLFTKFGRLKEVIIERLNIRFELARNTKLMLSYDDGSRRITTIEVKERSTMLLNTIFKELYTNKDHFDRSRNLGFFKDNHGYNLTPSEQEEISVIIHDLYYNLQRCRELDNRAGDIQFYLDH